MSALIAILLTTVFVGGNFYTLDPGNPRAGAIVARDGVIVYVGAEAAARERGGPDATVVDLEGRTAIPGLIDAHGHLGGLGALERGLLDLREAASFDEVVAAVREEVKRRKPGEWILGSRWDHESWPGGALPSHGKLSEAAPANPVWLDRVDGHMGLANRAAMEKAGIGPDTASPPGGAILRGEDGRPSGLFIDNAIDLVAKAIPSGERGTYADLVLAAQERCFRVGLTSVHDAGLAASEVATLRNLAADGKLKLGVYGMVSMGAGGSEYVASRKPFTGFGSAKQLSVRAVKIVADGAMGSRGAWLLAPYADRTADEAGKPWFGLPVTAAEDLRDQVRAASAAGFQVATHAIGDRANREVLDAYGSGLRRPRIEHAQLLALEDLPRFAKQGVIASMQPTHATSDMRWAEKRVGPQRLAGAYAWASLLRSGARLAFGSDFPVEAPDPLLGIYAAVSRRDERGNPPGGWLPGERATREEALRGFTEWAAYAAFEEDARGTLVAGKRADFVVLSRDVMTCEADEIRTCKVEMTVLGGEVVFAAR